MDIFFTEIVLSLVSIVFDRNHGSTPFKSIILYFISSSQRQVQTEAAPSLFTGRSAPRNPQPPFPPRGVGAFGCVRGPCPPRSLLPPASCQRAGHSPSPCRNQVLGRSFKTDESNLCDSLNAKRLPHLKM